MADLRITILDATLEQSERSPGYGLNLEERLRMAHQLERLSADVITAGTPMSSPSDFEAVRLIARTIERSAVAARCRPRRGDIERAWEAIQGAKKPRLQVCAQTSVLLLGDRPRDEILSEYQSAVRIATSLCPTVEFVCEDATRADPEFLGNVIKAVSEAGAGVVSLHDTAGCALPDEYGAMFRKARARLPEGSPVMLGAGGWNDLGLAAANVLAALRNGARQAECAVNGIGARAGVAALEEIAVMIRARHELLGWETGIVTEEIHRTSRLLSSLTGMPVQPNKPIVGANAFAHQASPGRSDMVDEGSLFEVISPQSVGLKHSTLILGKHSDSAALRQRYRELGYNLEGSELDRTYAMFRQVVELKREVLDEDLIAILEQNTQDPEEIYHLENIQVHSGTTLRPTATVELRKGTERFVDSATGDGPVDAAYKAIERITGLTGQLTEYLIKSMSVGRDGFGEVFVRAEFDGVSFHGRGVSTDIITGSARAYLEAVNRAAVAKRKRTQPAT